MGGFNSGRRGGFGTTDESLILDIRDCMRRRQFRPGFAVEGTVTWVNSHTRAVTGRLGYVADLRDPETGHVMLVYTATSGCTATQHRYRVALTTTRPYFGGRRWWFLCPISGLRVRCLHLASHSPLFASRAVLGLGYKVQREAWAQQRMRAARVIDVKLGGDGCLVPEPPDKPKRMRWATYDRLCEAREREIFRSFLDDQLVADCDVVRAEIEADPSLIAGWR